VAVRPSRSEMVGTQAATAGKAYEVELPEAVFQVEPFVAAWNRYPDQLFQAHLNGEERVLQVSLPDIPLQRYSPLLLLLVRAGGADMEDWRDAVRVWLCPAFFPPHLSRPLRFDSGCSSTHHDVNWLTDFRGLYSSRIAVSL
jgi:hypothetical protein